MPHLSNPKAHPPSNDTAPDYDVVITRDTIRALGDLVHFEELVRLIHVPRFGNLLALAIHRAWSRGVPVVRSAFGLDYMQDGTRVPDNTGCCIVGAAAVGTHARRPIFEAVSHLSGLSHHELDGVLTGFEASSESELQALLAAPSIHHNAAQFGAEVADAMGLTPRRNDLYVGHQRPPLIRSNEF